MLRRWCGCWKRVRWKRVLNVAQVVQSCFFPIPLRCHLRFFSQMPCIFIPSYWKDPHQNHSSQSFLSTLVVSRMCSYIMTIHGRYVCFLVLKNAIIYREKKPSESTRTNDDAAQGTFQHNTSFGIQTFQDCWKHLSQNQKKNSENQNSTKGGPGCPGNLNTLLVCFTWWLGGGLWNPCRNI